MTVGFDVFVHEVIAAIATEPVSGSSPPGRPTEIVIGV